EIVRAYANRTVAGRVTLFPADWVDQAWHVIDPPPRFVLAVAVDDDPAGATIATAHQTTDGKIAGRVVEWRAGPEAWVPAKVDEIVQRREVDAIVYDPGSPARALKAELEAISEGRMVPLVERSPRDFAAD